MRNLEREIGTVCRKVARDVAEGRPTARCTISGEARPRAARPARAVFSETRRRTKVPGVATGLAWTPVGGEVLFIEATAMPGTGKLTITGQLGDVMRESAQAALSCVRGHRGELAPDLADDCSPRTTSTSTSPRARCPRTARRAGVAMSTALSSLVSGGRCGTTSR